MCLAEPLESTYDEHLQPLPDNTRPPFTPVSPSCLWMQQAGTGELVLRMNHAFDDGSVMDIEWDKAKYALPTRKGMCGRCKSRKVECIWRVDTRERKCEICLRNRSGRSCIGTRTSFLPNLIADRHRNAFHLYAQAEEVEPSSNKCRM